MVVVKKDKIRAKGIDRKLDLVDVQIEIEDENGLTGRIMHVQLPRGLADLL